ncbi:unnamed protein product [Cuscuta epithymum]|uniref:Replication factor A C-terminal domain-containing protein n=1 Tax=Cuscuta epithymum TaxID=186058 RepID=A0AAV0G4C9_9ASTE|nr:unnamed protein product [Cuscuta epithymum]
MELVLVDEKKVRIQASISRSEIQLFEGQLEEGGLYAMCNFTVKANNGKWRPASHPFRLQFHEGTKVKLQAVKDHKDFPLEIYNFTCFNDIHNHPAVGAPDLIDIIGVYDSRDKFNKYYTEAGSTYTNFYIRDIQNKRLFCTLWNVYVDQFETYFSLPRANPVVVLLQMCRINPKYGGCSSNGVATSYHVTKLLLDAHVPEIEDFRLRYLEATRNSSQTISHSSSSGPVTVGSGTEIGFTIPLSELGKAVEVRGCWFYGQISSITSHFTWAYLGCKMAKCYKKLTKAGSGELVCDNCGVQVADGEGVWRYNLRLKVNHNNSYANLVFWDALCNRLIGKSAGDFPSHYYDMERLSPSGCPDEIKELVGREFVFKVDRQSGSTLNGKSYSIGMVSTDQDKIDELKSVGANQSDKQDYNSDEDLDKLFSSPVTVESNITPSSTEDDIIIQTTPSSTSKRPTSEQHVDSSAQSSTNKKFKGIKIEKPDA